MADPVVATAATDASGPTSSRWTLFAWFAVWSFAVYAGIVLPIDTALPAINQWRVAGVLLLGSAVLSYVAFRYLAARMARAEERLKDVGLLFAMLLVCFLGIDVAFTVYNNVNPQFRVDQSRIFDQRWLDARGWDGELMPVPYQPSDANFSLYSPDQSNTATVDGEHYYPTLSHHAVMRDSVLQLRRVEFVIDRYGLRNTDDPAEASIFALGDSFAFGYHMTQQATFPALLKERLGEPVYNLGVSGTSPMQQLLLLEHLLKNDPDAFKPKKLLWLIFEGNDLEESYEPKRQTQDASGGGLSAVFARTIVGEIASIPALLRGQSVIRLLTSGQIALTGSVARQTATNHYELDGETLAFPLYHSERFGWSIFRQAYVDQAGQTELDVANHPNLPRLVNVFRRMKALSTERGFDVTVVMVPTNVRLYRGYFEDLPTAEPPHFIERLKKISDEVGFAHVDLFELLTPYAREELIYHRDDTHWNERGHEIVANVLAEQVFGVRP